MEMLTFVELLKSVIYEIEQTGGDPLQRIAPPPRLVQLLKQKAFGILRRIDDTPSDIISTFLLDEFSGRSFDEGIRVTYTFLRSGFLDSFLSEELVTVEGSIRKV
jgi:hypothetical protein